MISVHRATEIQGLLSTIGVTPLEITQMIECGDLEVDSQQVAINAIKELDEDFIDLLKRANPDQFSLNGFIEAHGIDEILDECIKGGDYDCVLEHVGNHAKPDDGEFTEVHLERIPATKGTKASKGVKAVKGTPESWLVRHYGMTEESATYIDPQSIKDLMRNTWRSSNGLYATLETMGITGYLDNKRYTVQMSKSYAEITFKDCN